MAERITKAPARSPRYVQHDGFRMPMGFPVEGYVSGLRYRARAGDVFVATYPKCGTTWVQHIIYQLFHGGEPLPAGRSMTDTFPHLEEVGRERVEARPEPRLIKTHLPHAATPWHALAKYVYVARNPFDCAVSFYHHTRGFVQHYDFEDGTFDEFFECFIAGEVDFGDYFDNLIPWCEQRHRGNVLFLTYEEMRGDTRAAVEAIAKFLGGAAAQAALDDSILARVVRESSFERMSRDQQRWSSARAEGAQPFVRKGVVGDWANYFSPSQARRLAEKLERRTRGTPAAELWPGLIDSARRLGEDATKNRG